MARNAEGWTLHRDPRTKTFTVRFRAAGRRCHRSTGETDRAAAQEEAARIVREVTHRPVVDRSAPALDVSLPDLFGSWLAAMGAEVSPDTVRCWETYAAAHFIPFFETGEELCSDARLGDYMRHRLTNVKRTTLKKELSALNRLFDWMVEQKLLGTKPNDSADLEASDRDAAPEREARDGHAFTRRNGRDRGPASRALEARLSDARLLRGHARDGASTLDASPAQSARRLPTGRAVPHDPRRRRQSAIRARASPLGSRPGSARFERARNRARSSRSSTDATRCAKPRSLPASTAERASKVSAYDLRHSLATELTERSGNLVGVGYLLGHKHVTTTNQLRARAPSSRRIGPIRDTDWDTRG